MVGAGCDEEAIKRGQYRLRKQAAPLGFQLIPYRTGDVPWESPRVRQCKGTAHAEGQRQTEPRWPASVVSDSYREIA
jgi:hypothetical protein